MVRRIPTKATQRSIPNVLSKRQLTKLFESIDDIQLFMGVFIALFCGLRISEVCSLKKQNIDLEGMKVLIKESKHGKDRVVMLPESAVPFIEKWLRFKEGDYFVSNWKEKIWRFCR